MNYTTPANESAREQALREYQILDTEPDASFDDLVRLTASLLDVPIAMVSLVDADRQWFKAKYGTDACGSSREASFCTHTISGNAPMIVCDAAKDPRFAGNDFVTGPMGLRFYAGVPLVTEEGFAFGTLCAVDTVARYPTPVQIETLKALARQVVAQLNLWKTNRSLRQALADAEGMRTEAEQRQAAIASIDETAKSITSELDRQKAALAVVQVASKVCNATGSCLWFRDVEGSEKIRKRSDGPQWIEHPDIEPQSTIDLPAGARHVVFPTGSYLFAPVGAYGEAIGRIAVFATHPNEFTSEHAAFLERVAAQVGVAMWNASNLHRMEKENRSRISAIREGQNSLQYTEDILASLTSILIVIGADGRIQRWNRATSLAFGLDEKFALGLELDSLPIGWSIQPVIDALEGLQVSDEPRWMEDLTIDQGDGPPRIFGLSLRRLRLGEEIVSLIIGADITARRAAEEAARRQEKLYGELVANVTDVIFNVDATGCLLFLNPAWESLTGYTVKESLGRSVFEFVAPGDRAALFQQQILKEPDLEVEHTSEFRLIRKSGEVRWVEAHVHRQWDEEGKLFGSTGTLQDVTDRHRADVGEAEQAKIAAFLTSLSTEFINLRKEEMDGAAVAALKTTSEYLGLDRSVVCMFSEDRQSYCYAQGWSNDEFDFENAVRVWHPVAEIPIVAQNMERGQAIVWTNVDQLGREWDLEKAEAKSVNVQSAVFIPLSSRGLLLGFAAFSKRNPVTEWEQRTISLLKIVGTVFANTLLRFRTDAEVEWLSALALAESENILRSVLNSAPIALQAIDRLGTVTLCEGRGLAALGITADLALGTNIVDLYQDLPHLLRHFVRSMTGESFTVEEEWASSTLEIHFSPMLSPEGDCTGTIAVAIDITERVRADASARIRDRAIAASSNGITICDATKPDFPIIYANNKFLELSGYSESEILGRNCRFLQGADNDQEVVNEIRHALKNGLECRVSLRNYRKDGTMFWNDLSLYPVRDTSGRVTHYVGEQNDITVRKGLESQLHRAQKMESIGNLAAGVAHEINTPIQYVGDNLRFLAQSFQDFAKLSDEWDRLLDHCTEHPELATYAQSVNRVVEEIEVAYLLDEIPKAISQSLQGVGRVVEIVQSMKVFSHPGATGMEAADLNRCIESTLTVCRNEWRYVAQVETYLDRNLPLVECHPGELNQTILNLVVNAAHAIGDSKKPQTSGLGKITVTSRMSDGFAEIEIRDSGDGIPGGHWNKIFDPFFTTKAVGRGTGQGLAIVHSVIVDHHGGTIDFETGDKGTTFVLRIPITATNRIAQAA